MRSGPAAASRAFAGYAWTVVFFTVLLVWWGAATTTTQSGMVFADWPLSLGTVNPPGWLSYTAPFLEHSHRLLATWVGLLVLALFAWAYARGPARWAELALLVLALAVIFGVFIAGGAERFDAGRKRSLLLAGGALGLVPVAWLVWSWRFRGWTLLERLGALALLTVTAQAILGGLRVTEISDAFAVFHGVLAQFFFCLLVLIALAAGRGWQGSRYRAGGGGSLRLCGAVLVALMSLQLAFGASMRHFHRHGLADTDVFRTAGQWIPSMEEPVVAVLFLHKTTAYGILLFVLGLVFWLRGAGGSPARNHAVWLLALVAVQILLGIGVIVLGKSFWITNFHVLNGLFILAVAFTFAVFAWRGATRGADSVAEAERGAG